MDFSSASKLLCFKFIPGVPDVNEPIPELVAADIPEACSEWASDAVSEVCEW